MESRRRFGDENVKRWIETRPLKMHFGIEGESDIVSNVVGTIRGGIYRVLIELLVTRLWFICQMRAQMETRRRCDDECVKRWIETRTLKMHFGIEGESDIVSNVVGTVRGGIYRVFV